MTLTYRSTVGRRLTVTEGDGNIYHLSQAGANAYSPLQFGAIADGSTDCTAAWNSTRAACASTGRAFYIPAGDFLLTSSTSPILGQFTMFGDGPFKSRIIFRPTSHSTAALTVSNGASRAERVFMRDFAIYSDDTTYTKVALDLYDLSVCGFERLFIYGTGGSGPSAGVCWSGNASTSIGIRTHGREATYVDGIEIVADRTIVVAANPNTAATDGEDMDHWNWDNLYLVGNGNPLIHVEDGIGINEVTFDGYQAWVGGTSGVKINDTRISPTVPPRGIRFSNVRREQAEYQSSYVFDVAFVEPVQQFTISKTLMASTSNGIYITGFARLVLDQVTAAMSTTALTVSSASANSVVVFRGCIWQSGSVVSTTGLTQIFAQAYNSTNYSAPSDAVYAGQINGTNINVQKVTVTATNATEGLLVTGTTGDAFSVFPMAAGTGVQMRAMNNAKSDYEPIAILAESFDLRFRTGTNSTSTCALVDSAGQWNFTKRLFLAQDTSVSQNTCGIYAGAGAPNNSNGSNGDVYLRGDGFASSNTILYHKEGGSWVAAVTT